MDMQQMIVVNQQGIIAIEVIRRNNKEDVYKRQILPSMVSENKNISCIAIPIEDLNCLISIFFIGV